MTTQEILARLEGVTGGDGQWTAKCPAHEDRVNSLSVSQGRDGRVLLHCHAGCAVEDIAAALGVGLKDLFPDSGTLDWDTTIPSKPKKSQAKTVATYTYPNGAQKLRKADKTFLWRQPDGKGGWTWGRKGLRPTLYLAGGLDGVVYVCEGEKDADNLHALGYAAVSGEDGAGPGKWRKEYTEQLRGRRVYVFQDNDAVGKAYAAEVCTALHGAAETVALLDIAKVWPEIPEHGDVTDLITQFGTERASAMIAQLVTEAQPWKPMEHDPLLSLFKPLSDFREETAKWLVPGWIPAGQISLIAADGGIGKTTLWCHIIAALSNGSVCILDPPETTRQPTRVMFMTTEDSVRKKLCRKLRLAGANMNNIITPDFAGDRSGLLRGVKFGSPEMEKVLREVRPVLCVFDPVQGFTPPRVNMGSRNEMRDCMAPLVAVGEDIDVTALIVCHTNKRKGAFGRDRIADSADLWDIARSVMMAGYTDDQGVRYLTNEKNNYAPLQETVLFTIDSDEQIRAVGTSWKRDREYILGAEQAKAAPMREDCKAFILKTLQDAGGAMPTATLDGNAKAVGFSFTAVKRAKKELKAEGAVRYFHTGNNADRVWHIQLLDSPDGGDFEELPESTVTPFDTPSPSDISKVV